MLVRLELWYMLPIRRPSMRETPSWARLPCADTWAPVASPPLPPTSWNDARMAGTSEAIWIHDPLDGISLKVSAVTERVCAADCTSTIGLSPVTVTVSATAPTRSSASMEAVNPSETSTSSRRTVLKPWSANVTEYLPGGRLTTRYRP